MRNFNKKVAIHRRTEGTLNPSGEPGETWEEVTGESNRSVNISPLSVGAQAALRRAEPGMVKMSSHLVLCQRDTDIKVDDRLLESDNGYYVVQSKEEHGQHLRLRASITETEATDQGIFAYLDGDSQYFYRTDADFPESGISGATDITVQAWVKPDNIDATDDCIISKWEKIGEKRQYAFVLAKGEIYFWESSDGTLANAEDAETSSTPIVVDEWQHVAAVYDASAGTVDFYHNGAFVSQEGSQKVSIADKDPDFRIGSMGNDTRYFPGALYNVALFNDKRTASEISADGQDFDRDLSGEGNLIGNWVFDDEAAAQYIRNRQGDPYRALIPYDGGHVNFGNCGRTLGTIP